MTLEKRRFRDLQRIDQLGGTLIDGRYTVGGENAPWQAYEWLLTAGYLTLAGQRIVPTERGGKLLNHPDEREWLLTVRGIDPVTPPHRLPEAAHRDVYAYERAAGRVTASEHGDDELFLEDVARFAAVAENVDHDRVWLHQGDRITNLGTGEEFTGDESALFRWGPLSRQDEALRPLTVEQAASNYHELATFHRNAGRKTAVADATHESLVQAIGDVVGPSRKVVVKVTRRKYGIFIIDLDEHPDASAAVYANEELGLSLMHLEGDVGAYLVQEHVDMTFERRYFVVDGVAVTSAGAVEEYTPYDRVVTHSDPRMRRRRTASDPDIIWAPEQTRQLGEFVHQVTRELRGTRIGAEMTEYVLDVAFGPTGDPLIVEFNAIRNSGLYAADYSRVIRRLTDRPDVWGKAPHARARATVDTTTGE